MLAGLMYAPFFSRSQTMAQNIGAYGMVIGHEITHGFDNSGRMYGPIGQYQNWWSDASANEFEMRAQCMVEQYSSYTNPFDNTMHLDGENTLGENIAGGFLSLSLTLFLSLSLSIFQSFYLSLFLSNISVPPKHLPHTFSHTTFSICLPLLFPLSPIDNGGLGLAWQVFQSVYKDSEVSVSKHFTNEQVFFLSMAQPWCMKTTNEFYEFSIEEDVHSPGPFRILGSLSNFEPFAQTFKCSAKTTYGRSLTDARCKVW